MKKKLVFIIMGIALLILLASIPTSFSDNVNSGDQEYAYSPPVKLPKLPPKE